MLSALALAASLSFAQLSPSSGTVPLGHFVQNDEDAPPPPPVDAPDVVVPTDPEPAVRTAPMTTPSPANEQRRSPARRDERRDAGL